MPLESSPRDSRLQAREISAGDLAIQELGPKGDGVHLGKRGRIYVDRALPGDRVAAKVSRGADGVVRGELVELIEASPHRVTAPCPHYDLCGGCTLQHASDEFYRNWKIGIVRDALRKRGLDPDVWREPVFLQAGGRRRATFTAYKKNDVVSFGHFRRRARHVNDIASCLIVEPAIMEHRARLAPLLAPILPECSVASFFIQTVNGQFDVVITGRVGKNGTPDAPMRDAIARLAEKSRSDRVSWRETEHDEAEMIVERKPLRTRFGKLDIVLPPLAFLQPTAAGERALVDAVMELLPPSGKSAIVFRFRCNGYSQLLPEYILVLEKNPHKSQCLTAIPDHGCQYDALNHETRELKPISFHPTGDLVHGRTSTQTQLPPWY